MELMEQLQGSRYSQPQQASQPQQVAQQPSVVTSRNPTERSSYTTLLPDRMYPVTESVVKRAATTVGDTHVLLYGLMSGATKGVVSYVVKVQRDVLWMKGNLITGP